jgi:hypothetical protein
MTPVLGNQAAATSSGEDEVRKERRRGGYQAGERLRRFNQWLYKGQRLGQCGWRRGATPGLKRSESGRVHWSGIKTCGSVWACLLCAAKIRAGRAAEVDHLIKAHLAAGGHSTFLTFTLPHYASDDLLSLWEAMTRGCELATSGGGYQSLKARYGILGFIKAVEVTVGLNGWHPHLRVVIFHDTPLNEDDGSLTEFKGRFLERWARYIDRELNRAVSLYHGVDAEIVRDEEGIGSYVSKINLELTRSDLKESRGEKGRTPWQVGVDAADTGDAHHTARWKEWVTVSHSRRALSISPAIRDAYPPHETADMTDEELAQAEQDGEIELDVDPDVYDAILHHRHQPLRALVALAFADHSTQGVLDLLRTVLDRPVYLGRPEPGHTAPIIRFASTQAWRPLTTNPRRNQT